MRSCLICLLALLFAACAAEEDEGGGPNGAIGGYFGIRPETLQPWAEGVPYYQPLFVDAKFRGKPGATWSVSSGALPPGISLGLYVNSVDGLLNGTPTATGTFNFVVEYRWNTDFTERYYTLEILPLGSLLITTTALPTAQVSTFYGQNVTAIGGTGVGYTWSIFAGALPPGLTLDHRDVTLNWGAFTQTGNLDQSLGGGKLAEVSGIVASRSQPGVFWVHDDSGAGPDFYAIDAAGNVLQQYTIATSAQDWEDIALGPGAAGDFIYIADVGDNGSARTNCRILRIAEPAVPGTPGAAINLAHTEYWFTYPGGPQNCETMLVDWASGTPYLVEKVGTTTPRVHKFPMPLDIAWTSGSPVTLTQVTATGTYLGTLTGGDSSSDGRRVILRGYSSGREYALPAGSPFDGIFNQAGSAVAMPGGQQYEAVCYNGDGTSLFTTTEIAGQANAPIWESAAAADNGYTTISGTPTTAGSYTFTLQVRDSAGNTATRQFVIIVQ
jgi:hypothetical protein